MRPCTLLLRLLLLLAVAVLVLLLVPVLVPVLMLPLRFPFLLLSMPLPLQLLLVRRGLTHHPSLRLEIEAGSATTTDNAYQELQDASAFPASGPPPPRLQRTEIVTITSTSCPESAHIWPDQVHVNRVLSCPVSVEVFASSREDLSKDRAGTG